MSPVRLDGLWSSASRVRARMPTPTLRDPVPPQPPQPIVPDPDKPPPQPYPQPPSPEPIVPPNPDVPDPPTPEPMPTGVRARCTQDRARARLQIVRD